MRAFGRVGEVRVRCAEHAERLAAIRYRWWWMRAEGRLASGIGAAGAEGRGSRERERSSTAGCCASGGPVPVEGEAFEVSEVTDSGGAEAFRSERDDRPR